MNTPFARLSAPHSAALGGFTPAHATHRPTGAQSSAVRAPAPRTSRLMPPAGAIARDWASPPGNGRPGHPGHPDCRGAAPPPTGAPPPWLRAPGDTAAAEDH
jgi:hypothetical protein